MSSLLEGAVYEGAEVKRDDDHDHNHKHDDDDHKDHSWCKKHNERMRKKPSYDVEPDPETTTICNQILSKRLLCFCIVFLVFVATIVLFMYSNMEDFIWYAKDSGFPGQLAFFAGTVIFVFFYTYATYIITTGHGKCYRRTAFWFWIVFLVAYVFWVINLIVRTQFYAEGVGISSNGSLYLILSILMLCGSFVIAAMNTSLIALTFIFLALCWMMYLIYNWWYKTQPDNKNLTARIDNRRTFLYPPFI